MRPVALLAAALVAAPSIAFAQSPSPAGLDPASVRMLAAGCANCHGTDGITQGGMPNLAGQQRDYLIRTMQDFKQGKRPATIMHQLAKGYTDEQIEAISTYFSRIKPK